MKICRRLVLLVLTGFLCSTGCGRDDEGLRPKKWIPGQQIEREVTDYHQPPEKLQLEDDVLDPVRVPAFDPDLIHGQPMEGWSINLSRTVFHVDTPVMHPDRDGELMQLKPSYRDALDVARAKHRTCIPSVNLIDGKAKQFDDGLVAALESAAFSAQDSTFACHVDIVQRLLDRVGKDSSAAPFLGAGISLAGRDQPVSDESRRDAWLWEFERNKLRSKPLGFYNWSPELQNCYRFRKFFQQSLQKRSDDWQDVVVPLTQVLQSDPKLLEDYRRALTFDAQLTNPLAGKTLNDLVNSPAQNAPPENAPAVRISLFPASTSHEQRLFEKLFPYGFPEGADLMGELIVAVQKGTVDFTPLQNHSGWYDYQCFALEPFLFPSRGEESKKLLYTSRYKQRMLDAFAALMTKRRETHISQAGIAGCAIPPPLAELSPSLRLEPNATYYLRTARSYVFIRARLENALTREALNQLRGMRQDGLRGMALADELDSQIELFYGFYLLCLEDIGLRPALLEGELTDLETAKQRAVAWLAKFTDDPDLAADSRVIVPVGMNPETHRTYLWGTAGVRLATLEVRFNPDYKPSVRPVNSGSSWQLYHGEIQPRRYVIPVDEFVSIEVPNLDCPTREEFREICDQHRTREAISAELMKTSP